MMHGNTKWEEFRQQLRARGVEVRWDWQARRDGKPAKWPKQPSDIGMAFFYGNGFQPGVLCAVVIDYGGKDGFGLFIDDSPKMTDDVERIAGKDAPRPMTADPTLSLGSLGPLP